MTITIGHRRIAVELVEPSPAIPSLPAAEGASDAELARLAGAPRHDPERARWEAMLLMYGPRLP